MSYRISAVLLLAVAVVVGCGKTQMELSASAYTEPAEVNACDDSLQTLAAAMAGQAGFKEYYEVFQHFLAIHPQSTELHRELQSLFDAFQHGKDKVKYYKKLYEQNPASAPYAYLYGRCVPGPESRELFKKAVEIDPDYFWGHFGYALALMTSQPYDTAAAIEHYLKAAGIDNSYPGVFSQLVRVYESQGDLEQALKYAKLYAITLPDRFSPVEMQMDLLVKLNRPAEAEQTLVAFAGANPQNEAVRQRLVTHYRQTSKFADALKYQHELVAVAREPQEALVDLAKIYLDLDQVDSGAFYLDLAASQGYTNHRRLSLNPDYAPVRGNDRFPALLAKVKANAEQQRQSRLAPLLENESEHKRRSLEDKMELEAPNFSFVNLEGKTVSLADLRGKVVVVDFWATWCGPCRMTMPLLQEFVERKPAGVEFISLNVWENDTSKVRPYLREYGYDFNVLYGDHEVANNYQVTGIPTLVVIDPKGVIRYKHIGYDPHADQVLLWQTQALLGAT